MVEIALIDYLLLQVEHRDSVSHRTDDRVSILGEVYVPLAVNGSQQVRKLQNNYVCTYINIYRESFFKNLNYVEMSETSSYFQMIINIKPSSLVRC